MATLFGCKYECHLQGSNPFQDKKDANSLHFLEGSDHRSSKYLGSLATVAFKQPCRMSRGTVAARLDIESAHFKAYVRQSFIIGLLMTIQLKSVVLNSAGSIRPFFKRPQSIE